MKTPLSAIRRLITTSIQNDLDQISKETIVDEGMDMQIDT